MTEAEYIEQTTAVAEILTMKNRQDLVRAVTYLAKVAKDGYDGSERGYDTFGY